MFPIEEKKATPEEDKAVRRRANMRPPSHYCKPKLQDGEGQPSKRKRQRRGSSEVSRTESTSASSPKKGDLAQSVSLLAANVTAAEALLAAAREMNDYDVRLLACDCVSQDFESGLHVRQVRHVCM